MPDKSNHHISQASGLDPTAIVEALLFVSPSAASARQISDALAIPVEEVIQAIQTLTKQLSNRGIRVQENKGRYQLTSAPELSDTIETFLHLESSSRFSPAALETLAIIAYQQPITRPSVDAVRGVNSDSVIRNLLSKGLIEELGRSDSPGRPILYGTTLEFLQYFGLSSIRDLPQVDISRDYSSAVTKPEPEQQILPLDIHLLKE